jgi:hypothetical protein
MIIHDELWFKEYEKKERAHIQEIVGASMLSGQEKEWLEEYSIKSPYQKNENKNRSLEQIVMPNLFDKRRNYHT